MKQLCINLNELQDRIYECAVNHGWHEEDKGNEVYLALIASELLESMEADRKSYEKKEDQRASYDRILLAYGEDFNSEAFKLYIKDSIGDELADVVIRCLDLATLRGRGVHVNLEDTVIADDYPVFIYDCLQMLTLKCDLATRLETIMAMVFTKAEEMGIDLEWHILNKVKYNESRPYRHGGKRY